MRYDQRPFLLAAKFLAGLVLWTLPVATWPGSAADSPDHPVPRVQQKTITVRLYRGFLVIAEGHFGAVLEHQNFLLDTGTSPSIINRELAAPLDLTKSSAILASVGKDSKAQSAVLPEIEIGPIRVESLPVILSDLSQLEKDLGIPIAGIIGLDVLSKASFRLDYRKKILEFGKFSPGGIAVPLQEGSMIALAELNWGGVRKRMVVDTGSEQLVLLGKQRPLAGNFAADTSGVLAARLNSSGELDGATKTAASVTNQLSVQELPRAEIVLAGRKFSPTKAYWVPGTDTSDSDGLLGVRSLGFRLLSFDREHRTLHLSP